MWNNFENVSNSNASLNYNTKRRNKWNRLFEITLTNLYLLRYYSLQKNRFVNWIKISNKIISRNSRTSFSEIFILSSLCAIIFYNIHIYIIIQKKNFISFVEKGRRSDFSNPSIRKKKKKKKKNSQDRIQSYRSHHVH